MSGSSTTRRVVDANAVPFEPYDLEGPAQPEPSRRPPSGDRDNGEGCYLMRFMPGAVTLAHAHAGTEDFLILDGALTDNDGAEFRVGDFVSFAPGTRHHSWSDSGCLIAVFEWGKLAGAES